METMNRPRTRHTALLTAKEVAAILTVSNKTIYRWAKDPKMLPSGKLGGAVRFPADRVEMLRQLLVEGKLR